VYPGNISHNNSALPESGGAGKGWKAAAVIAAGGTGTRMLAALPKQFLEISGKPLLLHTIENIVSVEAIAQVIVALPAEHISRAESILREHPMRVPVECVAGGANRQESVYCGVRRVRPEMDIILVHDAVRPFCYPDMVQRILQHAWEKGSAVAGMPATETIQRVSGEGEVMETPARRELYAIQTPQVFHAGILRSALERASSEGFTGTDESSVVRWAGYPVFIVEGSSDNIKITRPQDLKLAELIMSGYTQNEEGAGMRIGQGIDYHRLVQGRKLILGGVTVPFEKGLEGHSDADVLAHAVCDALLGAASMGDIGRHFPDTDPVNRGRSSMEFLEQICARIRAEGWKIQNVDATLLAQKPKLAPYMQAMRQNIAAALDLAVETVNVKATTTEGLNAEGRGEGISAQAIALLVR
jgi:2-C-methyl-D-erythritol 4-phosphate cytidylyltransferase/2-C-methyl-D-erythritol 2,4-cyclodiphosphate synthase